MWLVMKKLLIFLLSKNLTTVHGTQLQNFLEKFDQFDVVLCRGLGQLQLSPNIGFPYKNPHVLLQCNNETSRHYLWPYLIYNNGMKRVIAVIVQPMDTMRAIRFLLEVGDFYKKWRSHASLVYFFISWPEFDEKSSLTLESLPYSPLVTNAMLPLNSRCYLFRNGSESHQSSVINFWEIYSIKTKTIVQPVNISDASDFAKIVERRSDFKGETITAIAKRDSLPILVLFKDINGTEFLVGGLAVDMMTTISNQMNFSLKALKANGWITEFPDGTVGGLGKQLVDKKADMTMQYSDLLEYRLRNLGISQPTYTFRIYGYFRKPPPSLYRNIYIDAFKIDLRIAVCSGWILILLSLLIIAYCKRMKQDSCSDFDDKLASNALLWEIGTICQKGWDYIPCSSSLRIIVFSSLLSSLLYYTAYSASIVAIFSVEVNPFRGFSDLLKKGFTIYGNELTVATYNYVKDLAREDGVSGFTRILLPSEGMKLIETSQSAFLSSGPNLIPFAIRANYSSVELCTWLTFVDAEMEKQSTVIYFQKYDPLQKFIGYRLAGWKEKGLLFRQQLFYSRLSTPLCVEKEREPTALGFQDIRSAFLVLILGFSLCCVILLYEVISFFICVEKYRRSKTYFYA